MSLKGRARQSEETLAYSEIEGQQKKHAIVVQITNRVSIIARSSMLTGRSWRSLSKNGPILCDKINLLMIVVTYVRSFQSCSPRIARKTSVSLVSRSAWFPRVANSTRWTLHQKIMRSPYLTYMYEQTGMGMNINM